MLSFLVFGFLFASVYGGVLPDVPHQLAMDWDRHGRIVGGEAADIRDAPYQVALLIYGYQSCGGSIIGRNIILTAGHCPQGTSASSWSIRAGSTYSNTGGEVVNVARFIIHENYNSAKIDFDISIMFLSREISLNGDTMAAVTLPTQGLEVSAGSKAFVTGWGATREGGSTTTTLQKVTIPIVSQKNCEDAYGASSITARMICAGILETGGQDACQGDSGGPLTVDGVLIGITSWGYGCARPRYPGVWSRVPYFRDWIEKLIQ